MAKNSTTKTEKPDTAVADQAEIQSMEQNGAVAGQTPDQGAAPEQSAPEEHTPPAPAPEPAPEPEKIPEAALFSLSELAEKHRLPGWHSAALHKMMGWQEGKKVSEAAYAGALASLKNRRCGG